MQACANTFRNILAIHMFLDFVRGFIADVIDIENGRKLTSCGTGQRMETTVKYFLKCGKCPTMVVRSSGQGTKRIIKEATSSSSIEIGNSNCYWNWNVFQCAFYHNKISMLTSKGSKLTNGRKRGPRGGDWSVSERSL